MEIKKLMIPFMLISFFVLTYNFIEWNVKNLDLRFYTGKDNGLSSYHDVLLLTVLFIYVDVFKRKVLALFVGLFYNVLLFLVILFLFGIQNIHTFFIIYFVLSLLPIIYALVLKKNTYLQLEFNFFDLFIIILYLFLLELLLRFSMKSSLLELLIWYKQYF